MRANPARSGEWPAPEPHPLPADGRFHQNLAIRGLGFTITRVRDGSLLEHSHRLRIVAHGAQHLTIAQGDIARAGFRFIARSKPGGLSAQRRRIARQGGDRTVTSDPAPRMQPPSASPSTRRGPRGRKGGREGRTWAKGSWRGSGQDRPGLLDKALTLMLRSPAPVLTPPRKPHDFASPPCVRMKPPFRSSLPPRGTIRRFLRCLLARRLSRCDGFKPGPGKIAQAPAADVRSRR